MGEDKYKLLMEIVKKQNPVICVICQNFSIENHEQCDLVCDLLSDLKVACEALENIAKIGMNVHSLSEMKRINCASSEYAKKALAQIRGDKRIGHDS